MIIKLRLVKQYMNNKGQSLVVFIIILPILLMIFTLIIDLGFMYIEKRNIDINCYDAVEYYLENINKEDIEEKVNNLLNENIKNIDEILIKDEEDYVEISITKNRKSIYSIISNNTEIKIVYKGMKDDKRIIKG